MDEPNGTEALAGTGWKVAVDQNPITGQWHWTCFEGEVDPDDEGFIAALNRGKDQTAPTREAAIEAAVGDALERHAGWVDVPLAPVGEDD